jgi:hypothetical protein
MNKIYHNTPDLENTMKRHLSNDLGAFGIWDNDYEKFLKKRGELVVKELNKRLNPKL